MSKSWVKSAQSANCDFPLQNLPYGVFSRAGEAARCGVAIGDQVLDLSVLEEAGLLGWADAPVFDHPFLNAFMETGNAAWAEVRARLTDLLAEGGDDALQAETALCDAAFVPLAEVEMHLPFVVIEYTDFYASRNHATNVGTMFRGAENALPPNWLHIPIGYNGRASSVVVSGTEIHRPTGQLKPKGVDLPYFGPSKRLDFELELGAVVGGSTEMGQRISVAEADTMIFGYVLLNDWSARDIQAWEYQPLGPFQSKAFGTSISPWVVSAAALAPFRVPVPERAVPELDYLHETKPGLFDITLEVGLVPDGGDETVIARTNVRELYYSPAQQLCHHASSGCPMRVGDLLGSGTISGSAKDSFGSLLELSWGGETPLDLAGGKKRSFLEDGDTVVMRGHAQGKDHRIGFGACAGKILPAV